MYYKYMPVNGSPAAGVPETRAAISLVRAMGVKVMPGLEVAYTLTRSVSAVFQAGRDLNFGKAGGTDGFLPSSSFGLGIQYAINHHCNSIGCATFK
jgi:hypothetical protein